MDALSGIMQSIGGFFSGPGGKALAGGGIIEQFIANWMAQRKQNDYINQQLKYQKNPQLMQNEITKLTQPLDQNLTAAVSNQVQGNLGAQGLSQSPNIQASVLAQALAPYAQQNQQIAAQEWYQLHGLPVQFPQQSNMMPLFRLLMNNNNSGGGGTMLPSGTTSAGLDNILFPPSAGGSVDPNLGSNDLLNWGLATGQAAA